MNDVRKTNDAGDPRASGAPDPAPGAGVAGTTVTLDPENPWLGLDSYTETTRAYFHGRDEEAAELARRVQRANLTVLFGQSGLGKTSLLRAGLVPRLRSEGYCPVYVRLDYAPDSPSPAEQIKRAVFRATREAGHWTRPGASVEGESLWEFLHKRDDLLRDAAGKPLIPFLIFDQFEEIFTLGQADDAGRARVREFIEDLADLVENRPPAALEKRMDEDEDLTENFDFGRADYRVLITLREDYLANLESLKGTMPSITQNRMRLARMTGAQALAAVVKPGGKLVSQEVAESIVRFVAGGSELANAEIEPSLLSLVCRELNTARLAQGRGEISADLLAGSRDTILTEFYERSVADQPEGVRRVIEDELLTESGYRESVAEERVLKSLADAGAAPDALATLVNRRLLRIEERLDMRRVELTHDVLCGVVLASRNRRHEREAREAAERELVEQREREAATHRTLVRTRMVATVCVVLMLIAIAAAAFGFYSMHRAHAAEAEAQASRTHAENLVSFMIEDFYNQLAPTGRVEVLGTLANKTVGYYDSLPTALVTRQTQINRAMALTREGEAQQASGKLDAADKNFGGAQAVFKKMYAAGDHSEAVTYGLALVLESQGRGAVSGNAGHGTTAQLRQAADLLRPLVHGKSASRRVRQLYADALTLMAVTQAPAQAVKTTDEALKVLAGLGAPNLTDLEAVTSYADATVWKAVALASLGRVDQARTLNQQVYVLAGKVLDRQPGNLHALTHRNYAAYSLAQLAYGQQDPDTALTWAQRSAQAGANEVRFNPSDLQTWSDWADSLLYVALVQRDQGNLTGAIATMQSLLKLEQDPRRPSSLAPVFGYQAFGNELAVFQAEVGDFAAAAASLKRAQHDLDAAIAQLSPKDPQRELLPESLHYDEAFLQSAQRHPRRALTIEIASLNRMDAIKAAAGTTAAATKNNILFNALPQAVIDANDSGAYAQAEVFARRLQKLPQALSTGSSLRRLESYTAGFLGQALAGQGKYAEARKVLKPALAYYRDRQKAGAAGFLFHLHFGVALYADALASQGDPDGGGNRRKADLAEAAKLVATAQGQSRNTSEMRRLARWIAAAQHSTK